MCPPHAAYARMAPPTGALAEFARAVAAKSDGDLRRLTKAELRALGEQMGIDCRSIPKMGLIVRVQEAARRLVAFADEAAPAARPAPVGGPGDEWIAWPTWYGPPRRRTFAPMRVLNVRPLPGTASGAVVHLSDDRITEIDAVIAAWRTPAELRKSIAQVGDGWIAMNDSDATLRRRIADGSGPQVHFDGGSLEGPPVRPTSKAPATRVRLGAIRPAFGVSGRHYCAVHFTRVGDGLALERVFPAFSVSSAAEFRRAMPTFGGRASSWTSPTGSSRSALPPWAPRPSPLAPGIPRAPRRRPAAGRPCWRSSRRGWTRPWRRA